MQPAKRSRKDDFGCRQQQVNKPLVSLAICVLVFQLTLLPRKADGCISNHGRGYSGEDRNPHSRQRVLGPLYNLLDHDHDVATPGANVAFSQTKDVHISKDEAAFGRIAVPYHMSGYSLTVTASWKGRFRTTPIWMHMKRDNLPTSEDWDRTAASFVSRKYARIRWDSPEPGVYYVMLEALENVTDLSIAVSLLPMSHRGAGDASWKPAMNIP